MNSHARSGFDGAFKTAKTTIRDAGAKWIRTSFMDLLDPNPEEIHLEDVAHNLSMLCRFGGSIPYHYSVAEHSVNCVRLFRQMMPPAKTANPVVRGWMRRIERELILHDASEFILGDVVTPLKREMPAYRIMEQRMDSAMASRFALQGDGRGFVKRIDLLMLSAEKRRFFPDSPEWGLPSAPAFRFLPRWLPFRTRIVRFQFLRMAHKLGVS